MHGAGLLNIINKTCAKQGLNLYLSQTPLGGRKTLLNFTLQIYVTVLGFNRLQISNTSPRQNTHKFKGFFETIVGIFKIAFVLTGVLSDLLRGNKNFNC